MESNTPKYSENEIAAARARGEDGAQLDTSPSLDPVRALIGTWTFGDADEYVRQQRKGWE